MGKQRIKGKKLPIAEKKEIFVTFGGLLLSVDLIVVNENQILFLFISNN